jgi:hypothetical protein
MNSVPYQPIFPLILLASTKEKISVVMILKYSGAID